MAMLMLLIASWSSGCAAFRTKVMVIPADKAVTRLEAGQTFTATNNGWFVPDARFQELLHKLAEKQP